MQQQISTNLLGLSVYMCTLTGFLCLIWTKTQLKKKIQRGQEMILKNLYFHPPTPPVHDLNFHYQCQVDWHHFLLDLDWFANLLDLDCFSDPLDQDWFSNRRILSVCLAAHHHETDSQLYSGSLSENVYEVLS